jgi:hypothetical protein
VTSALGATDGAVCLHEPDQPLLHAFALRAERRLQGHPVLTADAQAPPVYSRLWDAAFGVTPRYVRGQGRISKMVFERSGYEERIWACHPVSPRLTLRVRIASAFAVPYHFPGDVRVRVVRSVRVESALDWLRANWEPVVVVCRRHPLDVIASVLTVNGPWELNRLGPNLRAHAWQVFGVAEPAPDDLVACLAWRIAVSMSLVDECIRRDPDIHGVDHEVLCQNPQERLRDLATSIGLVWTDESDQFVNEHSRPGAAFEIDRIASEQSGKWRAVLTPDDARRAACVIAQFPIAERYDLP